MTEVPPCIYCKNCRIIMFNGAAAYYVCKNNFKRDMVTDTKHYRCCQETRDTSKCRFTPDIWYRIKQFFSSSQPKE